MTMLNLEKKHIAWLWTVNILLFLLMLAAWVLVDGNGCYPGLNETASRAVLLSLSVSAVLADGLVFALDMNGKRRAVTVGFALVYLMSLITVIW